MIFVLIFIALTLAAVTAFQFLYLAYLERVELEHKKRIRELERHCRELTAKLNEAEEQITAQSRLIESLSDTEEVWADVIDVDSRF
jgi:uncharacterized coiled-coil protein SlyX